MSNGLVIRIAATPAEHKDVIRLREAVYVQDQHRLATVADTAATFDRFDGQACYITGYLDGGPVGTIKVVPDAGCLPCDDVVDLSELRPGHHLVEFGHLMTLPECRQQGIGMKLMREALRYSVREHGVTHIIGDFFAEESGKLRAFYTEIGFVPLREPYLDARFYGEPLSVVAVLDVAAAVRRSRSPEGRANKLLQYFFHDYDSFLGSRGRTRRQELAEVKAAHNHPAYARMAFVMGCGVQGPGAGSAVADEDGRAFIALFDQYGNQSFGYSNPRITAALREQLDSGILNSTKIMFEEVQIRLAQRLAGITENKLPFVYLANSGGETIDNALKIARAATGRPNFISARGCFHGKTFATLSAAGRPDHQAQLGPFMDCFRQVPFGDAGALADALDDSVAAVLLEPVQAEAGVIVPPREYLRQVRQLCSKTGALLILDEMQTAFGRCGSLFAHQRFGAVPDLMCVGKALGGGMLPISAVLGTKRVWGVINEMPSTFGSSLGGNPLSCRAALATVEIASEEGFLDRVRERGATIAARLSAAAARHPDLIEEHRGVGMMHGLAMRDEAVAGALLGQLLAGGATSTYSLYNPRVVRVQPPLLISGEDLEHGLGILDDSLAKVRVGHHAGADSRPAWRSPVTHAAHLPCSAKDVLKLLHDQPRLLDPFAMDHSGPVGGQQPEFRGRLGDDLVVWPDSADLLPDGVTLRAAPCWLWRTLERTVTVTPDGDGCDVTATVRWDTGSGDYEELLSGRIGYFAAERLADLAGELVPSELEKG